MSWTKPTIQYCETNTAHLIRQPFNAISSLAISAAGVYILFRKAHKFSLQLGLISIFLGIASFMYYASNTYVGQLSDLAGMIMIAFLMLSIARKLAVAPTVIVGTLLCVALIVGIKTIGGFNFGIPVFAAVLLAAIFFEYTARRKSYVFYWRGFFVMAAALFFWILDYKEVWCSPNSVHYINGHGVWHLFNAAAIIMLDRHYESNKESL